MTRGEREFEVDRSRVEAEAERDYTKMRSSWLWTLKIWTGGFAGFLLVLLVSDIPGRIAGVGVLPWWGVGLLIRVVFASVGATIQTWLVRKLAQRSVDARARDARRLWGMLTGSDWFSKVVLLGVGMAVAVGVPVGSLLAWILPVHVLPAGSRFLAVGSFIALSLLWTLPMALIVRFGGVRHLRKYMVEQG